MLGAAFVTLEARDKSRNCVVRAGMMPAVLLRMQRNSTWRVTEQFCEGIGGEALEEERERERVGLEGNDREGTTWNPVVDISKAGDACGPT